MFCIIEIYIKRHNVSMFKTTEDSEARTKGCDIIITKYLQTKDLCSILGVSKNTAYKIVKLDGFPKIQIGKKFYIPEDDLEIYLKKHVGGKIKVDVDNR